MSPIPRRTAGSPHTTLVCWKIWLFDNQSASQVAYAWSGWARVDETIQKTNNQNTLIIYSTLHTADLHTPQGDLTVISLGKAPIIWDLITLAPVLPRHYAAAWRNERKKKSPRPFMVIRRQSPVINQTDRDTIEILYEFQPPRTIQNITEWNLILCSSAHRKGLRRKTGGDITLVGWTVC